MRAGNKKFIITAVVVAICVTTLFLALLFRSISSDNIIDGDVAEPSVTSISAKNTAEDEAGNTTDDEIEDYNGKAYYYGELQKLIVELSDLTS